MDPPAADIAIQGRARITNRSPHGIPGMACSRSAAQPIAATAARAWRGRSRSEADSRNHEAASRISGPPNMARPLSSALWVAE